MNKTYLLLGSNLGNSKQQLRDAINYIEREAGVVIEQSGLYQTAAWGNIDQPDFLNQVILVETALPASQIMKLILSIEEKMGRIRNLKNEARVIDIDILFFNKEVINSKELIIPHPYIQERRFVLVPMNEISPSFKHPVLNKTIQELLLLCTDELNVKKI